MASDFACNDELSRGGPCWYGLPSADQRVDAPAAGSVKDHEKEHPAVQHGKFAFIGKQRSRAGDREELCHRGTGITYVYHEIRDGHFAAADERANAREQTKGDEKSTNKLDPAAGLCERVV